MPPSNPRPPPGYRWSPPGPRGPTRCCAGHSAAHWSSGPAPRVRPPRPHAEARTTAGKARGPCSRPSAPRCGQGHSGRGWGQAVLPPTTAPPNELGTQETLISHCVPLPHGHGAIPTAVPRMPEMLRMARGHWLAGGQHTLCPPPSLSLTLGLPKTDLRATCHAPHPPEAKPPPLPSRPGKLVPSKRCKTSRHPRPRHVTTAIIESWAARREREALAARSAKTSALSFAILVVGRDGFLSARTAPSRPGPRSCPSSVWLGSTQSSKSLGSRPNLSDCCCATCFPSGQCK